MDWTEQKSYSLKTFPFLIVCLVYFASYWVFSWWVKRNGGITWASPLALCHHPFDLHLLDTHFFQTITYLFMQSPLYSIVTWLMMKTGSNGGKTGYLVLHYIMGLIALISLYRLFAFLQINRWITVIALSYFVFNPFFYFAFTSGWYDFLTMCLVSINAYCFIKLACQFNSRNLFLFIFTLTILVLYRSLYHPILFFLPVILFLMGTFRVHWQRILYYSLIPFMIVLAPYIKNYLVFHTFNVAGGSFGLAMRASTYEYQPAEILLKEVKNGRLSPLVLCYKQILQPVMYQGISYTTKNCYTHIIPDFVAEKVKTLQLSRPDLTAPAVLQDSHNNGFADNYIPNNLTGLLVAKQMAADAKQYLLFHPRDYFRAVQNNLSQLFRSNNYYIYLIADNIRHYPIWFGSRWFNFDVFKYLDPTPEKMGGMGRSYRPQILFGIVCSIVYACLYAGHIRQRNRLSLLHMTGLLVLLLPIMLGHTWIFKINWFMDISLLWSTLFIVPALFAILKSILTNRKPVDARVVLIRYVLFVCLYTMGLVVLVPGSEQERYRFSVEGLLIALFLFWINGIFQRRHREQGLG